MGKLKSALGVCARACGHTLLALVAACALLVGYAAWQVSKGPVDLSYFTPYVDDALTAYLPPGLELELAGTNVTWDREQGRAEIAVFDAVLSDGSDTVFAELPRLVVDLSADALLAGRLALRAVEIDAAQIAIERREDGSLEIDLPAASEGGDVAPGDVLDTVLTMLNPDARDAENAPLGGLERIAVTNLSAELFDRVTGLVWRVPSASLTLSRQTDGHVLMADITLSVGEFEGNVTGRLTVPSGAEDIVGELHFDDLDLKPLADLDPMLAPLGGIGGHVDGDLQFALDRAFSLTAGTAHLVLSEGAVQVPAPVDTVYDVVHAEAELAFADGDISLKVPSLTLQQGVALSVELNVENVMQPERVAVTARLQDVEVDDLHELWPTELAPKPRIWVTENLSGGSVSEATADIVLAAPEPGAELVLQTVDGRLEGINGVTVNYLDGLPKIVGTRGSAFFDASNFYLRPTGGTTETGLTVGAGTLDFLELDADIPTLNIEVPVSGDIKTTLELIDTPPLGFLRKLDLSPDQFGGQQETRLRLSFPLLSDLKLEDLSVQVESQLIGASMRDGPFGVSVTEGDMELSVDTTELFLTGEAMGPAGPIQLYWQEAFLDDADPRSAYFVNARSSAASLATMGLDTLGLIAGPVGFGLEILGRDDGSYEIAGDVNLDEARLVLPATTWEKPSGAPGDLEIDIQILPGGGADLRKLVLQADGVHADATGAWRSVGLGDPLELDFSRLDFLGSRLAGRLRATSGGGIDLDLTGPVFDATPIVRAQGDEGEPDGGTAVTARFRVGSLLLDTPEPLARQVDLALRLSDDGAGELTLQAEEVNAVRYADELVASPGENSEEEAGKPDGRALQPRRDIFFNVNRLIADEGVELSNLEGSLSHHDGEWRKGVIHGTLDTGRDVFFKLDQQDASRGFRMESDDAGRLLSALDLYQGIQGGKLIIEGEILDGEPLQPLVGSVRMNEYRLSEAPVMARVLSSASLFGLVDELGGSGVSMDRFEGDFKLTGDMLQLERVRANGTSVGITAKGFVQLEKRNLSLVGELVPAYLLNNALSAIPLLGDLLAGGDEGSGLIALTYKVSGELDEPTISVNPLSSVTPGFLRRLFLQDDESLRQEAEDPDSVPKPSLPKVREK